MGTEWDVGKNTVNLLKIQICNFHKLSAILPQNALNFEFVGSSKIRVEFLATVPGYCIIHLAK